MKSLIFLSLLLVYSLARVIPQNKYIVTVTDEAKSENPIKISKGKYTKILLTISEEKETNVSKGPFFPMATKIKLDQGAQNIFTTEYGEYTINPSINKEYEIMIGIKCDTTLPEGEMLNMKPLQNKTLHRNYTDVHANTKYYYPDEYDNRSDIAKDVQWTDRANNINLIYNTSTSPHRQYINNQNFDLKANRNMLMNNYPPISNRTLN